MKMTEENIYWQLNNKKVMLKNVTKKKKGKKTIRAVGPIWFIGKREWCCEWLPLFQRWQRRRRRWRGGKDVTGDNKKDGKMEWWGEKIGRKRKVKNALESDFLIVRNLI